MMPRFGRMRLRPLPVNMYTFSALVVLFGLFLLVAWRFMSGLPVNVHSLQTFSALLALAGTLAWLFGRPFLAGTFYLILGAAGTGAAWDRWTHAAGHWNKLEALVSGTPFNRDEMEMLVLHSPFLILGLLLVFLFRTKAP